MGSIGVVSDYAEAIVAVSRLLTPGHQLVPITYPFDLTSLKAHPTDAFVVPVFRKPTAIGRPIENFLTDLVGAEPLQVLSGLPEVLAHPILILGFGVLPSEIPKHIPYYAFLMFPEAIQELGPLLSGLVGPAPQHGWNERRQPKELFTFS